MFEMMIEYNLYDDYDYNLLYFDTKEDALNMAKAYISLNDKIFYRIHIIDNSKEYGNNFVYEYYFNHKN